MRPTELLFNSSTVVCGIKQDCSRFSLLRCCSAQGGRIVLLSTQPGARHTEPDLCLVVPEPAADTRTTNTVHNYYRATKAFGYNS